MISKLDSQNIMYHTIQNVLLSCKIILCTLNRSSKDSELKKYEIKNITISSLRFMSLNIMLPLKSFALLKWNLSNCCLWGPSIGWNQILSNTLNHEFPTGETTAKLILTSITTKK